MEKTIEYPVLLERLEDHVSYRAVLIDFNHQELVIKGNPFCEIRKWLKGHFNSTNIVPFPSTVEMERENVRKEQIILVSLH